MSKENEFDPSLLAVTDRGGVPWVRVDLDEWVAPTRGSRDDASDHILMLFETGGHRGISLGELLDHYGPLEYIHETKSSITLDLDTYQAKAFVTAAYPAPGEQHLEGLTYATLGLAGEAGEVAGKVSKLIRDERLHPSETVPASHRAAIADELGDVLWFLAIAAAETGWSLEEIATRNLEKLDRRRQAGTLHGSGDNR